MRYRKPAVSLLASSRNGTLYVGITSNPVQRIYQPQQHLARGFTDNYGVTRLVWYELHETMESAIQREKRIKSWNRAWKLREIEDPQVVAAKGFGIPVTVMLLHQRLELAARNALQRLLKSAYLEHVAVSGSELALRGLTPNSRHRNIFQHRCETFPGQQCACAGMTGRQRLNQPLGFTGLPFCRSSRYSAG